MLSLSENKSGPLHRAMPPIRALPVALEFVTKGLEQVEILENSTTIYVDGNRQLPTRSNIWSGSGAGSGATSGRGGSMNGDLFGFVKKDGQEQDAESHELWVTGRAIMVEPKPGWPISSLHVAKAGRGSHGRRSSVSGMSDMTHGTKLNTLASETSAGTQSGTSLQSIEPENATANANGGGDTGLSFPRRITFRIALATSRFALESFQHARGVHSLLSADKTSVSTGFPSQTSSQPNSNAKASPPVSTERYLAFWESPREGLWAIAEDRGAEVLGVAAGSGNGTVEERAGGEGSQDGGKLVALAEGAGTGGFWGRTIRPGILASERRWKGRIRRQKAEEEVAAQTASSRRSPQGDTIPIAADPLPTPDSATSEMQNNYFSTPLERRNLCELDDNCADIAARKVQQYRESLVSEDIATKAAFAHMPVEMTVADIPLDDDLDVPLERGYIAAIQVLTQMAILLQSLHDRGMVLMVCRPEYYTCVSQSPPGDLGFLKPPEVSLSRLFTVLQTSGLDTTGHRPTGPDDLIKVDTTRASRSGSPLSPGVEDPPGLEGAISGTKISAHLRYIAPEAVSNLRLAGPQADVFSFGVAAYELLSSEVIEREVEDGGDLLADLHRHSVRTVTPLVQHLSSIPKELCDVIGKAVSLDPDSRYLSMAAVISDLQQVQRICDGTIGEKGRKRFQHGRVDRLSRFSLPRRIVQREEELLRLATVFSRVQSTGNSEVVAVYGQSGEGKSALLDLFARRQESTSIVGFAKSDQHLIRPLSGFTQLLESLLDRVFSDVAEDQSAWLLRIRSAVSGDGNLIFGLLNEHWRNVIFGDFQEIKDRARSDPDWNSFTWAFRAGAIALLSLFADREPLILVQDDIQWQTSEERSFWVGLLQGPACLRKTILLCSYRTENDLPPNLLYPRLTLLRALPLTSNSLSYVLERAFHTSSLELSVPPWSVLTHFIITTTGGNAFHISALLSTLVRDGVIAFDFTDSRWTIALQRLPSYAVVEGVNVFTDKLVGAVSPEAQVLLRILACLPSRGVTLALLSRLAGQSTAHIGSLLEEPCRLGLIAMDGFVTFTHDRHHSSALNIIAERDRAELYSQITVQLEAETSQDYLFLRADMSVAAYDLGRRDIGLDDMCHLLLSAGRAAIRSAAFSTAQGFLDRCRTLLDISESSVWLDKPSLAMEMCILEADVGACTRRPQDALKSLRGALPLVQSRAGRVQLQTLCFRLMVANLDFPSALAMVDQAFIEAGVDTTRRVENLPSTPEELDCRMAAARAGSCEDVGEESLVLDGLISLVNHAGPTIYVLRPDHGLPLFSISLEMLFAHPAVLSKSNAAYCHALQAVAQADVLNWTMSRAYLASAQSYFADSAGIHPAIEIIFASLAYLNVETLSAVDYHPSYTVAMEATQDTTLIYTGALALATARMAGRSLSRTMEEGKMIMDATQDSLPPAQRFVLASSMQFLENLSSKRGRLSEIYRLEGKHLSSQDAAAFFGISMGFYRLNHCLCALGLALCLEAPIETLEQHVAALLDADGGGDGLIMSHEFGLLLSIYQLTRDDLVEPIMYRGSTIFLRTISTFEAFPQNVDYVAHRLGLLALRELQKLRRGQRLWHVVLSTVENAVTAAQDCGNQLLAGLLCRAAAYSFEVISPRVAKGFIVDGFLAFKLCEAYAAARLLAERFPDTVSVSNAWATAVEAKDDARYEGGKADESTPSTDLDTASSVEEKESGLSMKDFTTTKERLSLESILRSFLILASDKNSEELVRKVCEVLMMINRSDSACLALQDAASQELYLRGIGTAAEFRHYHQPVVHSASVCPASVILHAAHLQRPKIIEAGSRLLDREPFYRDNAPKSVLVVPLSIQGRYVGCILLSSKYAAGTSQAAHSQITLLGTFAAIVLESHSTTKSLELAVQNRTEQLSSAIATKATFLANVSHELRTPLHSIAGLSVIMANSADMPSSQRSNLGLISNAADDLLRIITQVLDWSRLDSGAIQVEARPFSLRETVEGSLDAVAHLATAKNLDLILETTVNDDPAILIGDGHRVRQGLLNLLANAIKFTSAGSIKVRWIIEIGADGRLLTRLEVKDTGLGIPADKGSALFQSFSQVDSSISRVYGGAGLGLVITQGLAKLMGGDCWLASSAEGQGSTFAMSFEARLGTDGEQPFPAPFRLPGPTRCAIILSPNDFTATANNLRAFGIDTDIIVDFAEYIHGPPKVDFVLVDLKAYDLSSAMLHTLQQKSGGAKLLFFVALYDMTATIERLGISHTHIITLPAKASALLHAIQAPDAPTPDAFRVIKKGSLIDKGLATRCPMRILFVDDSLVNLGVGVKILRKYGYTDIATATDGILAVEAERESKPDCIFLDLAMPRKDGYSAAEDILAAYPTGEAPVLVALTANTDQDTKDRCIKTGFTYFLSKPLLLADLVRILTSAHKLRSGDRGEGRRKSMTA